MKKEDFSRVCKDFADRCFRKHNEIGHENVLLLGLEGVAHIFFNNAFLVKKWVLEGRDLESPFFRDKLEDAHNYLIILILLLQDKWLHGER